jgi:hypothetical protein
MMRLRHMQPHRQSLQTLIWSRTSFNNDVFMEYAAAPAIITNVDLIKDILQKWCVHGVCSHIGNHYKRWFYQRHPSKMMRILNALPGHYRAQQQPRKISL